MAFKAEPKKQANFYTIKEGTFRLKSTKDDPEAKPRPFVNPKTKAEGVAYERVYKSLYGPITNVAFTESTLDDGTVLRGLNISLGKDESGIEQIASLSFNSRFVSDFLRKLPAIDLTREVKLSPWKKEDRSAFYVDQADDNGEFVIRVNDFFLEVKEDKKGNKIYKNLHGLPEPTDEDKSDWPFYFKKVEKFLVKYVTEHVLPKFQADKTQRIEMEEENTARVKSEFPDVDPTDLPF